MFLTGHLAEQQWKSAMNEEKLIKIGWAENQIVRGHNGVAHRYGYINNNKPEKKANRQHHYQSNLKLIFYFEQNKKPWI